MKIAIEFGKKRRTDVLRDEQARGVRPHPGWLPSCAENCQHVVRKRPEPVEPRWSTRWPC